MTLQVVRDSQDDYGDHLPVDLEVRVRLGPACNESHERRKYPVGEEEAPENEDEEELLFRANGSLISGSESNLGSAHTLWFRAPTHCPTHGQWWSYFSTHWRVPA